MKTPGWTLGISTSAGVEVALLSGDQEICVPAAGQALESLLPCVKAATEQAQVTLDDINLIAVCIGPGSFTGLRIGAAFAKSLAQSRDLPIVGISAYDVAEFHIDSYPVFAVTKGKSDYYYVRVKKHAHADEEFFRGNAAEVEQAVERLARTSGRTPSVCGTDFSLFAAGRRALAVARLGYKAYSAGRATSWRDIAIDYGQRPNAVINWETAQTREQEGQPFERRESQSDEGPASVT